MKKEVIIFDLDGTAINSPKQKLPSERLVKAANSLKSHFFLCAATGRVWSFASPVLQSLQLTDPCIISAGTQICDPVTGKILWEKCIDNSNLNLVLDVFRQFPEYKLLYNDGTEDDYFNGGVYPENFVAKEPVYFLEQVFIPDIVAQNIFNKLQSISGVTCVMVTAQKPGFRDLHIVHNAATKEFAVAELLRIINIPSEATIGVGDSYNDVHLFNAVKYKVAMGNAIPELKSMADEVIGPVVDDGLSTYFEKLNQRE